MRFLSFGSAGLFAIAMTATAATAQQTVRIDGDNISVRGCVAPSTAQLQMPFETLMWSRGGILTAGTGVADRAVRTSTHDLASRVLYWMDEDDLEKHVGKLVEVRGKLEGLEKGELEIERDGAFTEIRLELDGDEETIRVPTAWLDGSSVARASRDDADIDIEIATRKVDVDDVKVLGPCPVR
jgi:hypothetical protein